MPKENKQRGRREKRKRPEQEEEQELETNVIQKKFKPTNDDEAEAEVFFPGTGPNASFLPEEEAPDPNERPFYGLLDDEEQEYFRRADELLELNDFPSTEERDLFLANVYKEAEGKELKIANSQSCSRLMERLILLSNPQQKKNLFEKFSGHFLHLIQHRFASHCCETLFVQSAPVVTQELTSDSTEPPTKHEGDDGVFVSMENLFLYTLNELEGQMAVLLTDRFASHTLRVLLVVLSGLPLAKNSTKTLLQSRKKEKIGITGLDSGSGEFSLGKRAVPESFQFAVEKIISDTIAGLDMAFIRVLATHPTGNPTMQLLLELELTHHQRTGKVAKASANSIIGKLLPDDISAPESESASFINGLMYEPIGSRLLETVVTFSPGKLFKQIYRTTFKDRIGSLARNEIASFVVIKVLERLSKEDLEEAVTLILPQIPGLIERSRTTVIKVLLERCSVRKANASITALTAAINEAYGSDPSTLLIKMTQFSPPPKSEESAPTPPEPKPSAEALHGSLLAQAMLTTSTDPTALIQTALLSLPPSILLSFALCTITSHILQTALLPTPSPLHPTATSNLSFRRKLNNNLFCTPDSVLTLATSKPGSHTLDAVWIGTTGLMSLKERVAVGLVEGEALLREDYTGRVVWRNWMCDLFKRRRGEWIAKVKAGEGGAGGGMHGNAENPKPVVASSGGAASGKAARGGAAAGKTPLELARERFALNKNNPTRGKGYRPTGANAV